MTKAIERAKIYSETKLAELRQRLENIAPPGEVILTCGSYARREASDESDIDFFIITSSPPSPPDSQASQSELAWVDSVKESINAVVHVEPSEGGAFSKVEDRHAILRNIRGEDDNNSKITRRMLFLLEGEWLFNCRGLQRVRREILERYIGTHINDHQIALFLLNDIIRYYRTVAVDYEFKTAEGRKPKPWGIRNIKLVFSRKLLYASGLFSIAVTGDQTRENKIRTLENLFSVPVMDRMDEICGRSKMEIVRASYDRFLGRLEDPAVRERLKDLKREERDDPLFRELKNEGHRFTRALLKLFDDAFDPTHPIRRAVVF
jgi:predicted nucleotidyltransferase